jgi:DNA-binding NarL/FixJ family response regulator
MLEQEDRRSGAPVARIRGMAVAEQSVARFDARAVQRESPCILLLLDHDGSAAAPIRTALSEASNPPRVLCAFTPAQAARHLDRHTVDAVLMDLRFWDRLEPGDRDLLARGVARPVVVLLDEDDIVDPSHAVEVGAVGYYYKDQLDASFVRRLDYLISALAVRSPTPSALASERKAAGS